MTREVSAALLVMSLGACQATSIEDIGTRRQALDELTFDLASGALGPVQVDEGGLAHYLAVAVMEDDTLGKATGATLSVTIVNGTLEGDLVVVHGTPCTATSPTSFTCDPRNLGEDDIQWVEFDVRAPAAPGKLLVTTTVSGNEPDPIPDNNTFTFKTFIGPAPDLAVTLSAPARVSSQNGKGTATFSATAINEGGATAEAVVVRLSTFDSGGGFVSASPSCVQDEFGVRCAVGDLAPGESATASLTVLAGAAGPIFVDAEALFDGGDVDPFDNFDQAITLVAGAANSETVVSTEPIDQEIVVPCTGETLHIVGEQHLVSTFTSTVDHDRVSFASHPQGLSVVGDQGTTYRVLGVNRWSDNISADFMPLNFSIMNDLHLVSPGPAPDYRVRLRVHAVVNAIGEVTVETFIESISCE